jgi:hypothetical protein
VTIRRGALVSILFASFLTSALAFASSIPITGTVVYGNATTYGDFNISGPGLALVQSLPQGPSTIGSCVIGTVCDFSFGVGGCTSLNYFCAGSDDGSLGSKSAQQFSGGLVFAGATLYNGGASITVPLALSGSMIGYELVNCDQITGCQRGPEVFNLLFEGTPTGVFQFNDIGLMTGVQASL